MDPNPPPPMPPPQRPQMGPPYEPFVPARPKRSHLSNTNLTAYTFLGLSAALIIAFVTGSTGTKQTANVFSNTTSGSGGGSVAASVPSGSSDGTGAAPQVTDSAPTPPVQTDSAVPRSSPLAQVAGETSAPTPTPQPSDGLPSLGTSPPGIGRNVTAAYTVSNGKVSDRYDDVIRAATNSSIGGWVVSATSNEDLGHNMTDAEIVVQVPTSNVQQMLGSLSPDFHRGKADVVQAPVSTASSEPPATNNGHSSSSSSTVVPSIPQSNVTIKLSQRAGDPPSHIDAALTVGWDNDLVIISATLVIAMTVIPLLVLVTPLSWLTTWGLRRLGLMRPKARPAAG